MKFNKEMMNTMTAEELEAAEKDLLECNMLLMKYDEEGNEEDLDKIYEIISEMVAKGFNF